MEVEVFKDEKYAAVFDNDAIFIIPTADKPVKMVFENSYTLEESDKSSIEVILEAILRVKAVGVFTLY